MSVFRKDTTVLALVMAVVLLLAQFVILLVKFGVEALAYGFGVATAMLLAAMTAEELIRRSK